MHFKSIQQFSDPFGSTVSAFMEDNRIAPFEGNYLCYNAYILVRLGLPIPNISLFLSTIPFSLSDVIPNTSFLNDLTNYQDF